MNIISVFTCHVTVITHKKLKKKETEGLIILNYNILAQVRLSLISLTDLLNVVRPTRLVSSEAILDAITAIMDKSSELAYRGQMLVDQNIALAAYGAEVLQGEMRSYLLDGNSYNYDMERG